MTTTMIILNVVLGLAVIGGIVGALAYSIVSSTASEPQRGSLGRARAPRRARERAYAPAYDAR